MKIRREYTSFAIMPIPNLDTATVPLWLRPEIKPFNGVRVSLSKDALGESRGDTKEADLQADTWTLVTLLASNEDKYIVFEANSDPGEIMLLVEFLGDKSWHFHLSINTDPEYQSLLEDRFRQIREYERRSRKPGARGR